MNEARSPIVILGGIRAEVAVFADQLADSTASAIHGLPCLRGTLRGHPCVLAEMGMGKANAAMTTTLLLTHLEPRMVICAGGGGLNPMLQWGDTIIVEKTIHHDYGALRPDGMTRWPTLNPITREENPLYLPTDSTLPADTAMRDLLAHELAMFLQQLHAIRLSDVPSPPWQTATPPTSRRTFYEQQLAALEQHVYPLLWADQKAWISDLFAPVRDGRIDLDAVTPVLIHSDLAAYHIFY